MIAARVRGDYEGRSHVLLRCYPIGLLKELTDSLVEDYWIKSKIFPNTLFRLLGAW
jgi:hypothetical protein